LTFNDLLNQNPRSNKILVDIPIGLPNVDQTPRICDVEARKMLGIRRSSVFPAPIREILYSKNYEEANIGSKRLTGKGISKQTYGIIPKIFEVDEILKSNPNSSKIINEAHPEVCFLSLASGIPMKHNKKTQDGFKERIEILKKYWQPAEDAIAQAFLWYSGYRVARDDIVDALVLAIVATHSHKNLISIPQKPPVDDFGLPMQMISLAYNN
jgi:predicted RNase H-like nuclease